MASLKINVPEDECTEEEENKIIATVEPEHFEGVTELIIEIKRGRVEDVKKKKKAGQISNHE